MAQAGAESVTARAADVVAWISWPELADVVRRPAAAYTAPDASTEGTVRRLAAAMDASIAVHLL